MVVDLKLWGHITQENGMLKFHSNLYDGTEFSLNVDKNDVQLNESLENSHRVSGFLFVRQEAKQGDICYLTLPKPTLNYGKQISVKEHQLMPRKMSIEDFNPQNKNGI